MAQGDTEDSRTIEKTSANDDMGSTEIASTDGVQGQSRGNVAAIADLEKAIANVMRAIARAGEDDDVADLVAERREMRDELRALRETEARASGKLTSIDPAKRRGGR